VDGHHDGGQGHVAVGGVEDALSTSLSTHPYSKYAFKMITTLLHHRPEHHGAGEPEEDEARGAYVEDEATVAEEGLATHFARRRLGASRSA
jgi:hypothetical protein